MRPNWEDLLEDPDIAHMLVPMIRNRITEPRLDIKCGIGWYKFAAKFLEEFKDKDVKVHEINEHVSGIQIRFKYETFFSEMIDGYESMEELRQNLTKVAEKVKQDSRTFCSQCGQQAINMDLFIVPRCKNCNWLQLYELEEK